MRINCEVQINNRMLPSLNIAGKKKGVQSSLAIGKKMGSSKDVSELSLHICTLQNKVGTKFKIINNIQAVFAKFIEQGKFTIQLKEPSVDLLVKTEPLLAKGFLKTLKLVVKNEHVDKLHLSHLNAVKQHQIEKPKKKLTIKQRSDYPQSKGFPHTLEMLSATNISLNRIEGRITKLKYLNYLDFSDNKIKILPLELSNLSLLSVLNLKGNQIDVIPEQLFNSKLKDSIVNLDLSNNNIKNMPFSIGKLKKLEVLNLSSNSLVSLPYSFGRLNKLFELRLANNQISCLPTSMLHNRLNYLDLNCNPMKIEKNIIVNNICRLSSLLEIAAASCIKQGLEPQPWDIPFTLCHYLERYRICICKKIIFSNCIYGAFEASIHLLSRDCFTDINYITFLGYFCSEKCLLNCH